MNQFFFNKMQEDDGNMKIDVPMLDSEEEEDSDDPDKDIPVRLMHRNDEGMRNSKEAPIAAGSS